MSAMSAGPSPLIRLRGIEKIYGQGQAAFHALRGIDGGFKPEVQHP